MSMFICLIRRTNNLKTSGKRFSKNAGDSND
jgi:hypothetical protein